MPNDKVRPGRGAATAAQIAFPNDSKKFARVLENATHCSFVAAIAPMSGLLALSSRHHAVVIIGGQPVGSLPI
ncbi:MAG: hypothetical protein H7Y38_03955 [Armatimonadetes bacterium]|nr:hypothetical protein [Armatimonadota bacterium]